MKHNKFNTQIKCITCRYAEYKSHDLIYCNKCRDWLEVGLLEIPENCNGYKREQSS